MRFYIKIQNNVIINFSTIPMDGYTQINGFSPFMVGWQYINGEFIAPVVESEA